MVYLRVRFRVRVGAARAPTRSLPGQRELITHVDGRSSLHFPGSGARVAREMPYEG